MKKLKFVSMMLALAICSVVFVSCSDDDEDGGGSGAPTVNAGTLTTNTGEKVKVTGVYDYDFTYDKDGLLSSIANTYSKIDISYNPCKMIYDLLLDEEQTEYNVTFNGFGYISKICFNYKDKYTTSSGYVDLAYDGSGHLIRIAGNENGIEKDVNESYKFTTTAVRTYQWKNDNLQTTTSNENWTSSDGDKGEYKCEYTFSYDDAIKNTVSQFSYLQSYPFVISDELLGYVIFAGMLGKPSAYFPTSAVSVDYEEGEKYTNNLSSFYDMNNDGTIATEYFYENGLRQTINYNYGSVNETSASSAKAIQKPAVQPAKTKKHHGLLGRKRNK